MFAIIALVLMVLVALAVVGFVAHVLSFPFLLLLAVGIVAWIKFRPGRSRSR
jgi:hypothetical protein